MGVFTEYRETGTPTTTAQWLAEGTRSCMEVVIESTSGERCLLATRCLRSELYPWGPTNIFTAAA